MTIGRSGVVVNRGPHADLHPAGLTIRAGRAGVGAGRGRLRRVRVQRYTSAAVGAAGLWATTYAVIGLVGNTVIPNENVAVVVVVVAALALTGAAQLVQSRRR